MASTFGSDTAENLQRKPHLLITTSIKSRLSHSAARQFGVKVTVENTDCETETKDALTTAARDIRKLIDASRKRLAVSLHGSERGSDFEADPLGNACNWALVCTKTVNIVLERTHTNTELMLDFLVVSKIDHTTNNDDTPLELFREKADPSGVWTEALARAGSGSSMAEIKAYNQLQSDPLIGPAGEVSNAEDDP